MEIHIEPGSTVPIYLQIIYAIKLQVATGQLKPGEQLPTVRKLATDLRINPNTAHKVVAALVEEGLLEVKPGIGTVVSAAPAATHGQRSQLLGPEVERLVVEARKLGLDVDEIVEAVRMHWRRLR